MNRRTDGRTELRRGKNLTGTKLRFLRYAGEYFDSNNVSGAQTGDNTNFSLMTPNCIGCGQLQRDVRVIRP